MNSSQSQSVVSPRSSSSVIPSGAEASLRARLTKRVKSFAIIKAMLSALPNINGDTRPRSLVETLFFSYVDLENGLILDPDSHDENIGKIANAASRELGENNNAKYARSTTQMKTKIVNVVATRTIYSGNEILCAYGTKFSGQLHRLRDEVRSASRKKNPRRKRARKDEEAEEEEEDDDEQEDEGDVEEDEEEEEKDLPHRIKTPRLVDENEESDWTEDDGPLSSPPPPLPLPPPPAPKSSPPRVAPPPIQALFHVYNLRPKKDDRAQGPYRLRKKSPSRLGKVPSPISVR